MTPWKNSDWVTVSGDRAPSPPMQYSLEGQLVLQPRGPPLSTSLWIAAQTPSGLSPAIFVAVDNGATLTGPALSSDASGNLQLTVLALLFWMQTVVGGWLRHFCPQLLSP